MIKLKKDPEIKKYIFFVICSVIAIGAAIFYFIITGKKKNTPAMIIDRNKDLELENTDNSDTASIHPNTSAMTSKVPTTDPTTSVEITEPEFIMIDINSADNEELKKLNGIGQKLAAEIIKYREENGNFMNIEEITNVSGIGKKLFTDIRKHIYVVNPEYPEIS